MEKLKITKSELVAEYRRKIDILTDECDWVTYIDSGMICSTIGDILTHVGNTINWKKLHEIYNKEVDALNLTNDEWVEQFPQDKIIEFIYDILINQLDFSDDPTIENPI